MGNNGFRYRLREYLNQRGNALVLALLVLPVLIGAAGLALDWGRGVWCKTRMKRAADSAALAGVSFLPNCYVAWQHAFDMVNANYGVPGDATYTPIGNQYRVELSDTIPTFFMRLFGHDTMEVGVSSTAVALRPVNGLRGGAFPFAIINPNLNFDPTDDLIPSNYGRPYIIMYGEDNVMVPDWANGSLPVPPPSEGTSRGWRGALGLEQDGGMSNDAGTDDIVFCMLNPWPGTAAIGDGLPTKTGNMDNPLNRARNDLLGPNPLDWEDFDPRYHSDCERVAMVPIVHLVNVARQDTYTIQDYYNDAAWEHSYVVIDGFAPFFILTVSEQGDVDGDGNPNDRDWIVGLYVPGVKTGNFLPPGPNTPNYGLYAPPRLID